jgi:imidazole glycerol-phosphate synthase subunit HisH
MMLVVIDYGSGNLRSAAKACERAAAEAGLALSVRVTARAEDVRAATHIVLPGQGAFADCMTGLAAVPGMVAALTEAVIDRGRPFLGICVGMQLMAERGLEHGVHRGLGWIGGDCAALAPADRTLKIPHMGWNELTALAPHPVLAGIAPGAHAYFVHSYHVRVADRRYVLAETDYGGPVTAIVGRDNLVGTQFHVEKSQETGLRLIGNFLRWRP